MNEAIKESNLIFMKAMETFGPSMILPAYPVFMQEGKS